MASEGDMEPREASCLQALAVIFRGKLCVVVLRNRPVTTFEKDQVLYNGGDKDQTLFFLRSGFAKVGTITLDGHELICDVRKGGIHLQTERSQGSCGRHHGLPVRKAIRMDIQGRPISRYDFA
jgi:hypothetical protein